LGKLVVFHPAAVNWLLRINLSEEKAIALSLRHEFCHLQTLPLAVFYAGMLVIFSADASPLLRWPAILIGSQAVWEMMAEFLTLAGRFESYQAIYAEVTSIPRIVFWLLAAMAACPAVFLLIIQS
jgi:hypothetical protein